jgi:hypothetical protein
MDVRRKEIINNLIKLKQAHEETKDKLNGINKDLLSIQKELLFFHPYTGRVCQGRPIDASCGGEIPKREKEDEDLKYFDSYDFEEVTEICFQEFYSIQNVK